MTTRPLSDTAAGWFEQRKIDVETAVRLGIYTVSRNAKSGIMEPDARGNVIVFPFTEHGVEVNRKYRGPQKKFWQEKTGRRTFWNADVLDDPALEDGRHPLTITEGEMDALTAIDCGFPLTVSVPDGAPAVPDGKRPDDLDDAEPGNEATGKFEFLYNNRDRLKRVKRFVLAVDSDPPGKRLAAELVRRLGAVRCSFVTYPADEVVPVAGGDARRSCKDLNEVRMYLGQERVAEVLRDARPYPVRGLYRLSDYPDRPALETVDCGFAGWEDHLRLFAGEFMVISGIPSEGKSTFTLNLLYNLAQKHGWKTAICSPEMPAVPILQDRFRRLYLDGSPTNETLDRIAEADAWTERHFTFVDLDPTGMSDSDEPFDLQWIIDRAADAVLRDGIRVLVIDPWNEIEHAREKGESGTDYISRAIRMLKRFGRLYGVVVIVVAHPTKDMNERGKRRVPNLYDIEGSAAWYNKADHGIIVEKVRDQAYDAHIHIQKVKFREAGMTGSLAAMFDKTTERFTAVERTYYSGGKSEKVE